VEVTVTEQEPSVADQIAAALDKLSGDAARELGLAEPGDGQEAAPAEHQAAGGLVVVHHRKGDVRAVERHVV